MYVFTLVTWELGASSYCTETQFHSLHQPQLTRFPCINYSLGGYYLQPEEECAFELHEGQKKPIVCLWHSVYSDWSPKYPLEDHKLPVVCKYNASSFYSAQSPFFIVYCPSYIQLDLQYNLLQYPSVLYFLFSYSSPCSCFHIIPLTAIFLFFSPSLLQFNFVCELWCTGPVRGFLPNIFFKQLPYPIFHDSSVKQMPAL